MDPEVATRLAELAERVALLEADNDGGSRRLAGRPSHGDRVADSSDGAGRVSYRGSGPWDGRSVAWQVEREWGDVVRLAGDDVAHTLSALASSVRLRIVGELTAGALTTGDLADRLDQASSGQLFHHLRELMAVGIVHQPGRGVYALRPRHVVPMLAVLSAATDLASSDTGVRAEPPE